jgi:hypothetical protein
MTLVYLFAQAAVQTQFPDVTDLGGMILMPGVYRSSTTLLVSTAVTFDAQNDPSAQWIIQIGTSLTTAGNVILANGAQSSNILWQVAVDTTIGPGSIFQGSILSGRSVTLDSGATVNGRILTSATTAGDLSLNDNLIHANIDTIPTLVNQTCIRVVCENGGTCSAEFGQTCAVSCECVPGYSGPRCHTEINYCTSQPCQNGGTCSELPNEFHCTCSLGYSGLLCQTEVDECASRPCQHSGTCMDTLNSFTCSCTSKYTGAVCQTLIVSSTAAASSSTAIELISSSTAESSSSTATEEHPSATTLTGPVIAAITVGSVIGVGIGIALTQFLFQFQFQSLRTEEETEMLRL